MQLVELQRNVHGPNGHEVAVFAVSYDPVEVLAEFAAKHDISYPLLGDVGSIAITELGLLNTGVESERAYWGRAMEDRHRGLPYPGTFLLDADGVVVEKLFERSHRLRPGGKLLLDHFDLDTGESPEIVAADGPGLSVAAWVDTPEYFPNQLNRLTVRLGLADGLHVYVPPNPPGFIDLEIEIDPPNGVFVHPHEMPTGHSFEVEGLPEEFTVAEGEFEVVIPFYVLEDSGELALPVKIKYQACSETTCHAPDSVELVIDLKEVRA